MEIGRRRLDRISTLPALKRFDRAGGHIDLSHLNRGDERQLNVEIERFLFVEGNEFAVSS